MSSPLTLAIERGQHAGQRLPVGDTVTVGRQADNTLVVADDDISRHHARFTLRDGVLTVTDLGSANGTRVNGRRLAAPQVLTPGDLVEFGGTAIRVETPDGAATQVATLANFAPPVPPGPGFAPPAPLPPVRDFAPPVPPTSGFAPPTPPPARSRLPLLLGGLAALLVLCLCVGGIGIVALSRSGGNNATGDEAPEPTSIANDGAAPTIAAAGGRIAPTSLPIGGGAAVPTNRPAQVAGGAGGVTRGDYLCQAFTNGLGLVTVGGLHIITDTAVAYSTDQHPVAGAQQYTYRYEPATNAITFIDGPYDGREGTYDPTRQVIQVSPSVGCTLQR